MTDDEWAEEVERQVEMLTDIGITPEVARRSVREQEARNGRQIIVGTRPTPIQADYIEKANAVVADLVAGGLELGEARTVVVNWSLEQFDQRTAALAQERGASEQVQARVQRDMLRVLVRIWDDES